MRDIDDRFEARNGISPGSSFELSAPPELWLPPGGRRHRSGQGACLEQQTNAQTQAMNAMAEMVRALQIDVGASAESKFLVKDKESMTTKRAFTMLRHYSGKVAQCQTWRFQLIQFLSQEPYFVEFLE